MAFLSRNKPAQGRPEQQVPPSSPGAAPVEGVPLDEGAEARQAAETRPAVPQQVEASRRAQGSHPPPTAAPYPADPWQPYVVGVPGLVFEPRPPNGLSYRPDTVSDGWSTPFVHLRLASVRGYAHRYSGRPREDDAAAAWDPDTGTIVFAVADGVSGAQQPHIGSQLACRSAVDELLAQTRRNEGRGVDWKLLLSTVHWQLIEQARRILKEPEAGVEASADLLATTLVAGTAVPTDGGVIVTVVSVGDSGAWQIKYDQVQRLIGGKSPSGSGLVSSSVSPLPGVPTRISPMRFYLEPDSVFLVGTDGFGDPVGEGEGEVARFFARELRSPVPPLGFAQLLDFSRETFDDDRTLIALWPNRNAYRAEARSW